MGFVIVLLVVLIFLLFPVVALLAGGGILFVLYETFTDPVFISFLVVVIVGGGFLVIRAVKADSKYLDETATLFASKDNETDRRKVVRAYLLKRNQVERAFSTRKNATTRDIIRGGPGYIGSEGRGIGKGKEWQRTKR